MSKTRPTSAKSWRKRVGGQEQELPSGNVALIKRPGMEKLMAAGVMPDSLTPIALQQIEDAESGGRKKSSSKAKADEKAAEKKLMEDLFRDPAKMADVFQAFDRVTALCVVEPKVRVHWWTEQDAALNKIPLAEEGETQMVVGDEIPDDSPFRVECEENEVLLTDEVDSEDKQFIFQFVVGGTGDLETFRSQHSDQLAALGSE